MSTESTPRAAKAVLMEPAMPDLSTLMVTSAKHSDGNHSSYLHIFQIHSNSATDNNSNLTAKHLGAELGVPKTPLRRTASDIALRVSDEDDVFSTPGYDRRGSNITTVAPIALPGQEAADKIRRSQEVQAKAAEGYRAYAPRADRGIQPTAANAQGLFTPDALVFVAK